jgi:5-methylcytosine-specific restriction endonuclease McrA
MAKSLLDRLSVEDYALINQQVYYDPTSESGLRWAAELYSCNNRGHGPGDPVGRNFFIGKNAYNSSSIVLILNDIWPEDGQNVVTRKDPAGSWADVANLEWAFHGDSRRRNAELARAALVCSVLGDEGPDLGNRLRLNAPCKKGHLWTGHQLGLQRKWGQEWRCDECVSARPGSENTEKRKARNRQRYQANIDEERAKGLQRMKKLKETDPDFAERARLYARKRKAMLRGNTIALVTPSEIRARFAEFGHRCAFCNIDLMTLPKRKRTVEHLIPIIKGGSHSLSNIAPACLSCNSSKNDRNIEDWYRQQPFFTETRWRRIKRCCPDASTGQLPLL